MPILSEKEIKFGFTYYHRNDPQPKKVVELSAYDGNATSLEINCTQLSQPQYDKPKELLRTYQSS